MLNVASHVPTSSFSLACSGPGLGGSCADAVATSSRPATHGPTNQRTHFMVHLSKNSDVVPRTASASCDLAPKTQSLEIRILMTTQEVNHYFHEDFRAVWAINFRAYGRCW